MATMTVNRHPNDDALELYALGHLTEFKLEVLEEHLLICEDCRQRLVAVMFTWTRMKNACQYFATHPVTVDKPHVPASRWHLPTPVWASVGVAAVVCVIAAPRLVPTKDASSRTDVFLTATRGAESPATAHGGVRLHIDLVDLAQYSSYRVSLVSLTGREIWSTTATPVAARLVLDGPTSLTTQETIGSG